MLTLRYLRIPTVQELYKKEQLVGKRVRCNTIVVSIKILRTIIQTMLKAYPKGPKLLKNRSKMRRLLLVCLEIVLKRSFIYLL